MRVCKAAADQNKKDLWGVQGHCVNKHFLVCMAASHMRSLNGRLRILYAAVVPWARRVRGLWCPGEEVSLLSFALGSSQCPLNTPRWRCTSISYGCTPLRPGTVNWAPTQESLTWEQGSCGSCVVFDSAWSPPPSGGGKSHAALLNQYWFGREHLFEVTHQCISLYSSAHFSVPSHQHVTVDDVHRDCDADAQGSQDLLLHCHRMPALVVNADTIVPPRTGHQRRRFGAVGAYIHQKGRVKDTKWVRLRPST